MEDKYFNEFFDKLYNGKLNIYEDEEEESSEEDGDDNEQNSIIPENPNYSIELNTIKAIDVISKIDNYDSLILLFDNPKTLETFKYNYLNGFWELYDIGKPNKSLRPSWRKYIREGGDHIKGFKEYLKNFIENKDSDFEERLKELYYGSLFRKDSIDTIISSIGIIKQNNYSELEKSFIYKYLNGFWELYGMENNKKDLPDWRKYIRNDKGFKEYLKNFIENKDSGFEERLKELFDQKKYEYDDIIPKNPNYKISELNGILSKIPDYKFRKDRIEEITINPLFVGIKIIKQNNYSELENSFIYKYLNGFWELYDMENNERDLPAWRKYIRKENPKYIKGFKEYLKKFIENKDSGFEERLKELFNQKKYEYDNIIPENPNYEISELNGILSKIPDYKFMKQRIEKNIIKPILTGIKKIEKNYTDLDDNFKGKNLNGFWELYDMENNERDLPAWRKYIREGGDHIKGFKEYLKKFIEDKDSGFEERLNELFEQKGEGYEKTFTKKYGGEKYFEKINISNESRIHNLSSEEIKIPSIINNYVNSQIETNPEYLTTKLTDGDINCIKEKLVDPVYNNIINYLGNDENKVVSYDLECVQPLTNNGKTVINIGEKIEVKDILKLDSYYSEYIASPVKKSTNIETHKGKEIYKVFVENLLEKIKLTNESSGTFDKIINDVYNNISGMIIADDIYVPKENITLYISSQGQGYGRITLRYNINPKGNFYKIEKPKDNEDDDKLEDEEKSKLKPMNPVNPIYPIYIQKNVNESYDSYLDQLVENFFNTGKFFS